MTHEYGFAPPNEGTAFLAKPERRVPVDKGKLVYMIAVLHGIGVLLPWNMFITIAPQYYVDYWFTQNGTQTDYAKNFMSALGMASQFPNVFINILNIVLVIGGALILRIAGPLIINCISISAVIALIFLVPPTEEDMNWFYILTLVIVAIINLANGLYQNSIFGLFADFPANYTNAVVLGNNICGTFTTILSIVVTMVLDDVRMIAIVYFSISLVVLALCIVSLFILTNQGFYKYYLEIGYEARADTSDSEGGFSRYIACAKKCWVQWFNVFFIFFVTLTIFPAMMVATPILRDKDEKWNFFIPENLYIAVTTFLVFNVFATVGSTIANFVQFPSPRFLWVPVLLRGLLIPFFMFCNYRPDDRTLPVIFGNEWYFIGGGILMAVTSGYFSSLGMMYAPRVVDKSQAKIAGMIAALCLILGIFSGVSFTMVIVYFTTSF